MCPVPRSADGPGPMRLVGGRPMPPFWRPRDPAPAPRHFPSPPCCGDRLTGAAPPPSPRPPRGRPRPASLAWGNHACGARWPDPASSEPDSAPAAQVLLCLLASPSSPPSPGVVRLLAPIDASRRPRWLLACRRRVCPLTSVGGAAGARPDATLSKYPDYRRRQISLKHGRCSGVQLPPPPGLSSLCSADTPRVPPPKAAARMNCWACAALGGICKAPRPRRAPSRRPHAGAFAGAPVLALGAQPSLAGLRTQPSAPHLAARGQARLPAPRGRRDGRLAPALRDPSLSLSLSAFPSRPDQVRPGVSRSASGSPRPAGVCRAGFPRVQVRRPPPHRFHNKTFAPAAAGCRRGRRLDAACAEVGGVACPWRGGVPCAATQLRAVRR
jgi:hypothetical protein